MRVEEFWDLEIVKLQLLTGHATNWIVMSDTVTYVAWRVFVNAGRTCCCSTSL